MATVLGSPIQLASGARVSPRASGRGLISYSPHCLVTEAACWAHARRPWWDLYLSTGKAEDSIAAQALQRIAALYAVEKEVRGQPPDVRRAHRQARAGPLLDELHAWLSGLVGRVSAKSDLARAIGYTLTRWQALTRYRDDGRIEMDNNAAERALRGIAMTWS